MNRDVEVHVDGPPGASTIVGRLYLTRRRTGGESATFQYDQRWLALSGAYAIDPQLPLSAGPFHTGPDQAIFRALADTAPDRWGVELARRYERRRARDEHRTPRALGEADFLLAVRDHLRQGALRLRDPTTGEFLAPEGAGIPHLIDVVRLLNASARLERDRETDEELRLLLEAGSSLGGARPKANVQDRERLYIAKFPRSLLDAWSVTAWEKVALDLAAASGIVVPPSRLERIDGRPVLLVERFDRRESGRVGYISALTMIEARDGDRRSYLELAEAIEEQSPHAARDLQELWRRIAFSILISNTDDHLRNHGFLRSGNGWALSPAFDLNPSPDGTGLLSTAIEDPRDRSADAEHLVRLAAYFRVRDPRSELARILDATGRWRQVAKHHGVRDEAQRLAPAFEHARREAALRLV